MLPRTDIRKRATLVLLTVTVASAAVATAPALASIEPADEPQVAASVPDESDAVVREAAAVVVALALRTRIDELGERLGGSTHAEVARMGDLTAVPESAFEAATGGSEEPPDDRPGLDEDAPGAADWLPRREDPIEAMRDVASGGGVQTNAAHGGPRSARPRLGRAVPGWAKGSASASDGTRIGDGRGRTGSDYDIPDQSYHSVWDNRSPGANGWTQRSITSGQSEIRVNLSYDRDGRLMMTELFTPAGQISILYGEDGEPIGGYWVNSRTGEFGPLQKDPDAEGGEKDPDSQPVPDGETGPKRRDCSHLPTSRDECPPEVAPESTVSQPGRGETGGSAGYFKPSVDEVRDVVTQPNPEATSTTGGGSGEPSPFGGPGGTCAVCGSEAAPRLEAAPEIETAPGLDG